MTFDPGAGLPVNLAIVLAGLVCGAFMLLPGFGIAWGLGRRSDWSLATTTGAAFAFTMFGTGVIATVAHYARLSLTFALVASAVLFAGLTVAGVRLGRGASPREAGWQGLVLALGAAGLALFQRPWFAFTADTFYHLAAVRSLLQFDRPLVTDPFYGVGYRVLDPTSGVWHTMLGMLSRATGLDPMWLWPGATAVGAAMTALGFWVLAERVGRSRWAASIATLGLLLFPLTADMRWFAYPNRMSLALIFLALAGVADLMERSALADAVLVVAAGFGAISLHMAAAAVIVMVSVFLGVLLIVDVGVRRVRSGVWELKPLSTLAATGLVLAAISVAVLLPKAGVVSSSPLVTYQAHEIVEQTMPVAGGWRIAKPEMFRDDGSVIFFATLLGLMAAVPAFGRGDRRALAAFGICVAPAFFFMFPPLASLLLDRSLYLTSRVAILLRFPVYVGIAWGLGTLLALGRGEARDSEARDSGTRAVALRVLPAATALVAIVVAASIGYEPIRRLAQDPDEIYGFAKSRRTDMRYVWGVDTLERVWDELGPDYPVIAGDAETTYYLSGLMPVAVVGAPYKHAPFPMEARDGEQRRTDMRTLIDPATPSAVRRGIVEKRDVDYVVINPRGKRLGASVAALREERELLEPVVDERALLLFRVKR